MDSADSPEYTERARLALIRYWRSNLIIMSVLLLIWAVVGLGCGILWADWLNQFQLPGTGYPLGFWFAQQGSILIFVLLILAYALIMNRVDQHHIEELHAVHPQNGDDQKGGAA